MTFGEKLDTAVRAVCPHIVGVSVGRRDDKSTWRVEFGDAATADQRRAAESVMAAHTDLTDDAEPDAVSQLRNLIQRNPDLLRQLGA